MLCVTAKCCQFETKLIPSEHLKATFGNQMTPYKYGRKVFEKLSEQQLQHKRRFFEIFGEQLLHNFTFRTLAPDYKKKFDLP